LDLQDIVLRFHRGAIAELVVVRLVRSRGLVSIKVTEISLALNQGDRLRLGNGSRSDLVIEGIDLHAAPGSFSLAPARQGCFILRKHLAWVGFILGGPFISRLVSIIGNGSVR
jgi:hypothetical protein